MAETDTNRLESPDMTYQKYEFVCKVVYPLHHRFCNCIFECKAVSRRDL